MKKTIAYIVTGIFAVATACSVAPYMGHELDISKTGVAAQESSTSNISTLLCDVEYETFCIEESVEYRTRPHDEAENIAVLSKGTEILYTKHDREWLIVPFDDYVGFIKRSDVLGDPKVIAEYDVPTNRIKSWMGHTLFGKKTKQYKLQQIAYTGDYGMRMVDGRFCIAIGTGYYNVKIGDYLDLVLANGTVIPVVVADTKANIHTDASNKVTSHNGCAAEFVIDSKALVRSVKRSGDASSACPEWQSTIVKIRRYDINAFD